MQMENCDMCGKLTAAPHVCRRYYSRLSLETENKEETLVSALSLKLFFLGFFLMFVGVVVLIVAAALHGDASVSVGSVVFIGPIPIILGAGPHASLALLLAVILTIVGFIMFFWLRKTKA